MLNELYKLKTSLEKCGIMTPQIHPSIQNAGKKEGLKLYIDDNGISSLEYVDNKTMGIHWKISKDLQHSFPVFKLDTPIYKTKLSSERLREISDNNDVLKIKGVIDNSEFAYDHVFTKEGKKTVKKWDALNGRIYGYPKNILDIVLKNNCPKDSIPNVLITYLMNWHDKNPASDKWFLKQLTDIILTSLKEGKLNQWGIAEIIFFGAWDKKNKQYQEGDISLVLEIADYMQRGHQMSDGKTKDEINDVLLKMADCNIGDKKKDAYGCMQEIETNPFPNPNLPVLGVTSIFSMFEEAQCHWRYKRIGSSIFPVGKNLLTELNSALLYIVDRKRQEKTWQKVPSGKSKQVDLLISYLEEKPDDDIGIAGLFSDTTEDEEAEVSFEESSSAVFKALEGRGAKIPEHVQLLVISKVDPGRKQVLLNARYDTAQIVVRGRDWNTGSKNHPVIYLYEDNEQVFPQSLSPAKFMRIFHSQWIRQGLDSHDVIGVPLRDVYDVFLGDDNMAKKTAEKMLYMIIQRNSALLLGICGALWAENWKEYKKYTDEAKKSFLKVISAVSILLWKLKIGKEEYMTQAPFYVGRMLALSDTLHREYCKVVRKSDIPPQLIGNSLMTTALDNPEKGLARLSERLPIYQAWAQKAQGDDAGLAKWALSELGEVSSQLKELPLPKTAGDAEKAQILLGYLARTKSNDKNK